jgi:hypothetical protein
VRDLTGEAGSLLVSALGVAFFGDSGEVTTGLPLASVDSPSLGGVLGEAEVTSFPFVTLSPPVGSFDSSPLMMVSSSSANPTFAPLRIEIFFSACSEMRSNSVTKV